MHYNTLFVFRYSPWLRGYNWEIFRLRLFNNLINIVPFQTFQITKNMPINTWHIFVFALFKNLAPSSSRILRTHLSLNDWEIMLINISIFLVVSFEQSLEAILVELLSMHVFGDIFQHFLEILRYLPSLFALLQANRVYSVCVSIHLEVWFFILIIQVIICIELVYFLFLIGILFIVLNIKWFDFFLIFYDEATWDNWSVLRGREEQLFVVKWILLVKVQFKNMRLLNFMLWRTEWIVIQSYILSKSCLYFLLLVLNSRPIPVKFNFRFWTTLKSLSDLKWLLITWPLMVPSFIISMTTLLRFLDLYMEVHLAFKLVALVITLPWIVQFPHNNWRQLRPLYVVHLCRLLGIGTRDFILRENTRSWKFDWVLCWSFGF